MASLHDEHAHVITTAPGNAGIGRESELLRFNINDPKIVADYAADEGFDLVVIGPEAPLVEGVADAVRAAGVPVFGPNRAAAAIEGSKTFAKEVMNRANVPTGGAQLVSTVEETAEVLDRFGAPYVVKADGLASGKGVLVTNDRDAALGHAAQWLSAGRVLVEEFLDGQEVSLFVFSDGETVRALPPAQDFKRLGDGDAGPNTGGMGAYTPVPFLAERYGDERAFARAVVDEVAQPVIDELRANGTPFVGLLYCGLIVTDAGIRVIEFNARFGDPETQAVLQRLGQPLSELLLASATGRLAEQPAELAFRDDSAVTVVLASEGYPEAPKAGRALTGLADAEELEGVKIFHAATADTGSGLTATGGRVLNVVGVGADLAEARERAYSGLELIGLEGGQFRRDIAERAAVAQARARS